MPLRYTVFFLFLCVISLLPTIAAASENVPHPSLIDFNYKKIQFTEKEQAWLEKHPVIRARVGNNPPLHFYDGDYQGVSVDYLNLIAEMIGFKVEYVTGIPWPETLDKIKNKEIIDLVLTAKKTKEREKFMLFSDDYLMMPWVIFSRADSDFISSVNDLKGKTVAVEKGFVMQEKLTKEFPAINLLVRKHSAEALEAVASGEAVAYIGNLATSTYIINKYNLTNIKVACPAPFDNHNQAFVVRNDWPEFVSLLNKAIHAIPYSKLSELRNKWFNMKFEYGITKSSFFKWIGTILAVAIIFGLICTYWIITLRKQIAKRKRAEKERNELAQRLQQSQKMEAIGTLAGGIAHDFNNLLGVIYGYAELLKDEVPPNENFSADIDEILTASTRARDLVKQILTFSRQSDVKAIPIQIQPLLHEALRLIRSTIPTTIEITEDIDPKCLSILADPSQIHQIIMNLCTNAYHAMENNGGSLRITLAPITIKPSETTLPQQLVPGEYTQLIVTDTGDGIGPDIIDKIFDPYFTTKEVGKGTGMGLAISHGIVQEYGGTMTVDSQLGKGSTFTVYFPTIMEDTVVEQQDDEEVPKGTERILLVDDETILADMAQGILQRLGYEVTVSYNSVEALDIFKNRPDDFDVVITDQTMPGLTGVELAREILSIKPNIPIILCTGYSNLVDEHSAKSIGIQEFALKPLTRQTIANLTRKVLDG